jgi:hypothetical protein
MRNKQKITSYHQNKKIKKKVTGKFVSAIFPHKKGEDITENHEIITKNFEDNAKKF